MLHALHQKPQWHTPPEIACIHTSVKHWVIALSHSNPTGRQISKLAEYPKTLPWGALRGILYSTSILAWESFHFFPHSVHKVYSLYVRCLWNAPSRTSFSQKTSQVQMILGARGDQTTPFFSITVTTKPHMFSDRVNSNFLVIFKRESHNIT